MAADIPIFHIASFSRSGETLLLRTLAVHSRVEVVHNLFDSDSPEDLRLVKLLKSWSPTAIPSDHPLLGHRHVGPHTVLVLKNAVWEHDSPFQGLILVRNPFSVIASTGVAEDLVPEKRRVKVDRWCSNIDPAMFGYLSTQDNLTAFCLLYARKMAALHATGLPIVHYERLVRRPRGLLGKICRHLSIGWEPQLMKAHSRYPEGQRGHGRIVLSDPIHCESLQKHKRLPEDTLYRIYGLTSVIFKLYGYEVSADLSVSVREDFKDRFRRPSRAKRGRAEP